MTNKPKTNKWDTIEDILFSLHIRFCPLFEEDNAKNKITQKHCNMVKDKLRKTIKDLITQTQQETLEWCEKELEKTTVWKRQIAQNRNGIDYCATCEQAYEDCSCPARNSGRNRVIQEMRQTIKQRKEDGKDAN